MDSCFKQIIFFVPLDKKPILETHINLFKPGKKFRLK
jgi:hypothetical protein